MANHVDAVYDINNMILLAFVGICIKLFFGSDTSKDGSSGRASSSIWGYGVVALAMMVILVISFALASNKFRFLPDMSTLDFFKGVLQESFPALFTLIILFWLITLNLTYFKRINTGLVPSEYFLFSNTATFLVIFQLIALFKYLKNRMSDEKSAETTRLGFGVWFLAFLNLVLAGMMNITLEFFSTDG
jgi:hypothetical protein